MLEIDVMLLICTRDENFVKYFENFSLKNASTTYIFQQTLKMTKLKIAEKKFWFDISV